MASSDPERSVSSTDIARPETPGNKPTGEWAEINTYDAPSPVPAEPGASTDPLAATDPAASPAPNPTDARYIQHYELIRELGRGGMGVVHLARDLRLGRLVAIKMLTRPGHHRERFLAEARATARCRHENIVVIHDMGIHGEQPYLVFEYLRGQTLRQWMEARTGGALDLQDSSASPGQIPAPLAPTRAVEMIVPVVRALACAHGMGIIHRDLKPANILLTDGGITKVLDFGVAKIGAVREDLAGEDAAGSNEPLALTALGARLGTLPYMSPEQLAGEAVDHRSDIWAIGIILYELVTGAHPLAPLSMAKIHLMAELDTPMPGVREHRSDLGPLADIISRCLLKDRGHRPATARELLQELEALLPAQRTRTRAEDSNPFAGLAAFQESDADRFFGRDHEATSLVSKLRSLPLVAVTGPSGAGKSSLVRAGVIPALKRSGEGWEAMVTRPGRQPLAALAEVLLAVSVRSSDMPTGRGITRSADQMPQEPNAIIARLRAEPGYLGITLRTWARAKLRRVVLFVDQFEELYTLGADAEERACVLACLGAVADDVASPLRVILSIRSDFLDRLVEQRIFLNAVNHGLTFLSPLDRGSLREALIRPVEACDHRFESPAMVDRILDELELTRSPLPLLQFTADKLWAQRDRGQRMLTESSLHAFGGVSGALASHADAVLASMPAHDARLARAVFLRLVTPERTRALATMAELRQLGGDAEGMGRVLTRLVDARLLGVGGGTVSAADSNESDGMVEIVHESLVDTWPLLGQWLVENEEGAIFLTRLRSAARDWERGGQAAGLLWTGEAAHEAHAWRQRYQGELAPAERRYLDAVLAGAERTRRVRRRLFGGILSAAVVVAIVMAWLAWQQARAHQEVTMLARHEVKARQTAAGAAAAAEQEAMWARDAARMVAARALPEDPTTQLALLREIEDTSAPPRGATEEAKRLLHGDVSSAVLTGYVDYFMPGYGMLASFSPDGTRIVFASGDKTGRVWRTDGTGEQLVLRGHDDKVRSVAFSRDGTRIVSASDDKTVRVWRADGFGEPVVLRGHDKGVWSASFSPDGTHIVSASWDKTVRVWRADGSGEPLVLRGHHEGVGSASFSPDGTRIVSTSKDKTVRVWRTDGSGEPLVLRGHREAVAGASFSPDGTRIVSVSEDQTVRVWRTDGSGEPLVLRGHDEEVGSASFSPDGTRIVLSALENETVRVWRVDGSGESLVLRGHDEGVVSASFSPDGARIVSASIDKTVRVWRADGSGEPLVLRGHRGAVAGASFSPDGTRIMSASTDETVRVWRTDGSGAPLVLRGHDEWVGSASFSPDGTRIVSASKDKTVRVWRADGSGEPLVLRGHDKGVWSASFSPDGTRIVSVSEDQTVRVWRTDGFGKPVVLRGHDGWVRSASFSPGGTHIVSPWSDQEVRVWRADGIGEPVVLRGHDDVVRSASFSPDGTRIVSASWDKTVRVWRADGTGEPVVLRGHDDGVWSVSFSPDGTRIVSASDDTTVRIWRAEGTGEPVVLRGHDDRVRSVSFSPDGTRILSASDDKTARVWRADGTGEPAVLRGHDGEFLSPSFSPNGKYIVSGGKAIRIWRADGTGEPVVLTGHSRSVYDARFSPDGLSIVSASGDGTVRIWRDLVPIALDDLRLWTATTYCMPIDRRIDLLGVSEEQAKRDLQRCLGRVEQARHAEVTRP